MACAEQPIKKRRLYESIPESQPPPPPQPESQSPSTVVSSFPAPVTPSPPSQEEIQTRSRNREEIRRVHDCYKRLKSCIGQRDGGRRSANLEQAYRSLISASKDIDECEEGKGRNSCGEQTCVNVPGSWSCEPKEAEKIKPVFQGLVLGLALLFLVLGIWGLIKFVKTRRKIIRRSIEPTSRNQSSQNRCSCFNDNNDSSFDNEVCLELIPATVDLESYVMWEIVMICLDDRLP
ncbi:unnamed protein product [Arabidopsis arenosa]|uniref:Uncharacterized protein n=1 Tax=Arabidopsis arenosa TaxID=38785 RepID=A0A8S2AYK7_ARAAE|nr:unnamed protein product [Arabidopsis arenosa]